MTHQDSTKNQNTNKSSAQQESKSMFKLGKVFSLTLMAVLGAFLMISCDSVNSNTDKDQPKESEITIEMMENPKNPYDEAGATHNQFLDFYAQEAASDTSGDLRQALLIIEKFYGKNDMEFGGEQMQQFEQMFQVYGKTELGIAGSPLPTISGDLCELFPTICDILTPSPFNPYPAQIDDLDEENGGTSTERTLKFIETTKDQEAQAMEDRELKEEERAAILTQLATARYSAAYWHNMVNIQKEKSSYYKPFIEANTAVEARCHTCDVVGTDAAGAGIGAIFGGPVGAGVGGGVASAAVVIEKIFW